MNSAARSTAATAAACCAMRVGVASSAPIGDTVTPRVPPAPPLLVLEGALAPLAPLAPPAPENGPDAAVFLHPSHLQYSWHGTPAWKHSQYFLRHADFLQWQPFLCRASPSLPPSVILSANACGLRSSIWCRVDATSAASPGVLQQFWQLQSSQNTPAAKHSQYSFRHLLFLQLHFFEPPVGGGSRRRRPPRHTARRRPASPSSAAAGARPSPEASPRAARRGAGSSGSRRIWRRIQTRLCRTRFFRTRARTKAAPRAAAPPPGARRRQSSSSASRASRRSSCGPRRPPGGAGARRILAPFLVDLGEAVRELGGGARRAARLFASPASAAAMSATAPTPAGAPARAAAPRTPGRAALARCVTCPGERSRAFASPPSKPRSASSCRSSFSSALIERAPPPASGSVRSTLKSLSSYACVLREKGVHVRVSGRRT